MNQFQLFAAPPTPFDTQNRVNLEAIEKLAEYLIGLGVSGVFVCGTTGESANLSTSERHVVAEKWLELTRKRIQVIVHVGHTVQSEAVELTRHAVAIGASGVASTAPYYFKPSSNEDLLRWLEPVGRAAEGLPLYYYHIPSVTNVKLPVAPILRAGQERIPNLRGAKFTYEDLEDYAAALEAMPGGTVFFGRDDMLLAALALGSRAAVGSTYNLLAPIFLQLIAAFESGDLENARALQFRADKFIAIINRYGNIPSLKALLTRRGVPLGEPRAPIRPLRPEERDEIFAAWDALE